MLPKYIHEIRDPIHVFIRLDSDERDVVDSPQFQRLRHIHQLAMSYLVYPGATHKRFEHALGTMELATKVFDVITHPQNVRDQIRSLMPEISQPESLMYWRRVLRMAALCHDIGHLPFSHATEELLPKGFNHERITAEIIKSEEMREIWTSMTPPLRAEHIAKVAVGGKINTEENYSDWENILSEIIVGDAFGVDRMDYLLRDSLHTGVAYGRFDHHRLLDTIRILPPVPLPDETSDAHKEPAIGVEEGGIHSAQALLLARYFMRSQVYFHPIRVIYDKHLNDFLSEWLDGGEFPVEPNELIKKYTDTEVLNAISIASKAPSKSGHVAAKRITERKHFKRVYSLKQMDQKNLSDPGLAIYEELREKYGYNNVYRKEDAEKARAFDLRVLGRDGRITSEPEMLESIPATAYDFVFVAPEHEGEASRWLATNMDNILSKAPQSQEEEQNA